MSEASAKPCRMPGNRQVGRTPWHIIGEFPPQPGGVSAYTHLVAEGLAQCGDEVHVWCMPCAGQTPAVAGVEVHREMGKVSQRDLRRVGEQLDRYPAPRRILVQWVPHGFGYRSMNVGFCLWLWQRAARGDSVEIMAHEAYLPFGRNGKQTAAALVHRLMTIVILRAASRVWLSIPEWEPRLKRYALGRKNLQFRWLPVPSNIPVVKDSDAEARVRAKFAADGSILIGHFGTHGWPVTSLLEPILDALANAPGRLCILLLGTGSEEFREKFLRSRPHLEPLIQATGPLDSAELSSHIAACDLFIQPYPDGVSSRRGSAMVALAHGKAVITTYGRLTAPMWREPGVVALAPAMDAPAFVKLVQQVTEDPVLRSRMGQASKKFYEKWFDVSLLIGALRGGSEDGGQPGPDAGGAWRKSTVGTVASEDPRPETLPTH